MDYGPSIFSNTADGGICISSPEYYDSYNNTVTKLVVSEGIEEIGATALGFLMQLREVELPNSLKKIGDYAFYKSGYLNEITIPKNAILGAEVFSGTYKLTVRAYKGMVNNWDSSWKVGASEVKLEEYN